MGNYISKPILCQGCFDSFWREEDEKNKRTRPMQLQEAHKCSIPMFSVAGYVGPAKVVHIESCDDGIGLYLAFQHKQLGFIQVFSIVYTSLDKQLHYNVSLLSRLSSLIFHRIVYISLYQTSHTLASLTPTFSPRILSCKVWAIHGVDWPLTTPNVIHPLALNVNQYIEDKIQELKQDINDPPSPHPSGVVSFQNVTNKNLVPSYVDVEVPKGNTDTNKIISQEVINNAVSQEELPGITQISESKTLTPITNNDENDHEAYAHIDATSLDYQML